MKMVYFYGTGDGKIVKVGSTSTELRVRRNGISRGQFTRLDLRLLAAVRGTRHDEDAVKEHFAHLRLAEADSTEVFHPQPELIEYINWLRQQWFTWLDENDGPEDIVPWQAWCPNGESRRVPCQRPDPNVIYQLHEVTPGTLTGTPWSSLSTPPPLYNDYYTPPRLIECARQAMGGIDLDPASHWVANRIHKIPLYYHVYRSAFHNPWKGRVWLNPPYGDNAPWIREIIRYWDAGDVTQLCMLSPVWVFSAAQAAPLIERSSAMVLLSPTPSFWGRNKKNEIRAHDECGLGTNLPHAILYMGPRTGDFHQAFAAHGIPMNLSGNRGDGTR